MLFSLEIKRKIYWRDAMKVFDAILSVLLWVGLIMMFFSFTAQPDGLNFAGIDFVTPENNGALYAAVAIIFLLKVISSFIKKTNEIHTKFFENI
jgi:uncharacterized membrane protein